VHEAAIDDIKWDRDVARRNISLSKVKKFEQLSKFRQPLKEDLVARFGPMPKPNDAVDVSLLDALAIGAVDFLVSQDQGVHGRARRVAYPVDPGMSSDLTGRARSAGWMPDGKCALTFRVSEGAS